MPNSPYFRDLLLQRSPLLDGTGAYMSLHIADPSIDGRAELGGGGYERQRLDLVRTAAGTMANENEIAFESLPTATARFFGVWDAQEGGHFLTGGSLLSPVELQAGQALRYRETDLVLRIG